jgi:prepilin-type N-terminal cleavage/methylation domain-containing protein
MAHLDDTTAPPDKPTQSGESFWFMSRIEKTHATGFTLVEVIASLLIVGILGSIAGMGIVTGLRGYMQAKENGHLAQKAQIALTRINRELMELTDVIARDDGADPWIVFDNRLFGRQAIAKVGAELQLFSLPAGATNLSGATGDTLIDQVDSFSIRYFNGLNPDWVIGEDIDLLSTVEVNFVLRRKEGREGEAGTVPFSTIINPRNTANFGGAPTTNEPVTASQYQCFVSTAASSNHFLYFLLQNWSATGIILVVICAILAVTVFFQRVERNRSSFSRTVVRNKHGSVLVGLVVTLLLFAALGAGMVSLIGTSSSSQVTGNTAVRAYYIAESGFRYAASRYLNTTDTNGVCRSQDEKNQVLADLHDGLYTLAGDDGKFRLKILPYYLTVSGNTPLGSNVVATQFSGGKPEGFSLPSSGANARIKIDRTTYAYSFYNESTGHLTLSKPLAEYACANAIVKLIGFPAGTTTMTRSGNLTLGDGGFFPSTQGRFTIAGETYGYASRDGNVLENITNVEDPHEAFGVSVDTDTEVVLEPFVQVRSIGMVGQGDLTASREVVYNVPIPERPHMIMPDVFHDEFDNDLNWRNPVFGDFEVQGFEGDKALAVTDTQPGISSPKAALIAFNWSTKKISFASAHKSAGRFLSYDAQVKILFDSLSGPGDWQDGNELGAAPDGLPKYFMAGIVFRLHENLNTYGLSLTRGSANTAPTPDNIAQELIPQDQTPMLVLWQSKIGNTPADAWLAYGVLPQSIQFADDMESGPGDWTKNTTAGDEWTLVEYDADATRNNSPAHSWTSSPGGSYGDGEDLYLVSPALDLSGFGSAVLTFWTRYQINLCNDFGYIEVSTDDGTTWSTPLNDRISIQCGGTAPRASSSAHYTGSSETINGNRAGWVKKILNISAFTGNSEVKIRFHFNRNDGDANGEGWWIDDVRITAKEFLDLPDKRATVMVRAYEAAVVRFSGGGTGAIEKEAIVTQPNGASGIVVVPPVLSSGTWAGGSAAGMLWLNKLSPTPFENGNLYANGAIVATVIGYTPRTNLIKAYYNHLAPSGGPHNNPYDQRRLAQPRGELKWPADEGEPTENELDNQNDYFTLIEWDTDVNRNVPNPVQRLKDENGKYTIISTDTLLTPADTYFPFTRPEIGLQAFGHGAVDLYFDDVGLQVYFISGSGFLQPIQQ